MRLKRWMLPIPFLAGLALAYGVHLAMRAPDVSTADRLARTLKAKGIKFDRVESIDTGLWELSDVDEGLRLLGDDLLVEILRIEDMDSFVAAELASLRYTRFQGGITLDVPHPVDIYTRWPYVVVIRKEPQSGQVLAILQEVIPPAEWT